MICYMIIPLESITTIMINLSEHTHIDNIRVNNAGTNGVVKFNADSEFAKETFISYIWYNETEMQDIIDTDEEWSGE